MGMPEIDREYTVSSAVAARSFSLTIKSESDSRDARHVLPEAAPASRRKPS